MRKKGNSIGEDIQMIAIVIAIFFLILFIFLGIKTMIEDIWGIHIIIYGCPLAGLVAFLLYSWGRHISYQEEIVRDLQEIVEYLQNKKEE